MDRFDLLLNLVEASLEKNGDKVLTIKHLRNMMKMVNRKDAEISEQIRSDCNEAIEDFWGNS